MEATETEGTTDSTTETATEAAPDGSATTGDAGASLKGDMAEALAALEGEELEKLLDRPTELLINGEKRARKLREWIQDAQKGTAADERFRKAAEIEKTYATEKEQLSAFFQALQDPEQIVPLLERYGFPVSKAIETYAAQRAELEKMDPKDREVLTLRQQFQAMQQQREQERAQLEQERAQQETNRLYDQLTEWAEGSMEKNGLTREVLGEGHKHVWRAVVSEAREIADRTGAAPTAEMFAAAAAEVAKIVRAQQAAAPAPKAPPPAPVREGMVSKDKKNGSSKKKRMTITEVFKNIDSDFGDYDGGQKF